MQLLVLPLLAILLSCSTVAAPNDSEPLQWYERTLPMDRATATLEVDGLAVKMTYGIVGKPECRRTGTSCPVMVVLPGGAQNDNLMSEGLRPWAEDLEARGWLVLSPVALDGEHLFFGDHAAGSGLDQWLAHVSTHYGRTGRPFTLVGVSNGGISALQLAARHPGRFAHVLVAPGYMPQTTAVEAFGAQRVTFVIGEHDTWRAETEQSAHRLAGAGARTHTVVAPGTGHGLFGFLETERLLTLLDTP
ncbi:MAG: alpha/beta hydrolase [Bradymonadia bacterium]